MIVNTLYSYDPTHSFNDSMALDRRAVGSILHIGWTAISVHGAEGNCIGHSGSCWTRVKDNTWQRIQAWTISSLILSMSTAAFIVITQHDYTYQRLLPLPGLTNHLAIHFRLETSHPQHHPAELSITSTRLQGIRFTINTSDLHPTEQAYQTPPTSTCYQPPWPRSTKRAQTMPYPVTSARSAHKNYVSTWCYPHTQLSSG